MEVVLEGLRVVGSCDRYWGMDGRSGVTVLLVPNR